MKTKILLVVLTFVWMSFKIQAQAVIPSPAYSMNVLTSFKQYNNFNCGAVSVIKCALATFGADQAALIDSSGDTIKVVLRNHEQLLISRQELKTAGDSARLKAVNSPSFYYEALILYAAMAKRAVKLSVDGDYTYCTDYDKALCYLDGRVNNGVSSEDLPALLGLKAVPQRKRGVALNYVGHNAFHAIYATYNKFDNFGSPRTFTDLYFIAHFKVFSPERDFAFGYFTLADQ